MDAKLLLVALLIIPMILLIGASTMEGMTDSSRVPFQEVVVNETLGSGADTYYTAYPGVVDGITAVWNGSVACPTANYSVDYFDGYSEIEVVSECIDDIEISYMSYQNNYDSFLAVRTGTWNGYTMGAQLPFVYIAIAVITLVLSALGLSRIL